VHLWRAFFDLWEQRNERVHGNDKSTKDGAKGDKVVSQIKHLHTKRTEVLAPHRSIMFMTTQDDAPTREQTDPDENALDAYL
jgi:hypothetical protein